MNRAARFVQSLRHTGYYPTSTTGDDDRCSIQYIGSGSCSFDDDNYVESTEFILIMCLSLGLPTVVVLVILYWVFCVSDLTKSRWVNRCTRICTWKRQTPDFVANPQSQSQQSQLPPYPTYPPDDFYKMQA